VVVTGDPKLDDQYKAVANMSVDLEDGVTFHFYVNRKYRKRGFAGDISTYRRFESPTHNEQPLHILDTFEVKLARCTYLSQEPFGLGC